MKEIMNRTTADTLFTLGRAAEAEGETSLPDFVARLLANKARDFAKQQQEAKKQTA